MPTLSKLSKQRCNGLTTSGRPCKNYAVTSGFCTRHWREYDLPNYEDPSYEDDLPTHPLLQRRSNMWNYIQARRDQSERDLIAEEIKRNVKEGKGILCGRYASDTTTDEELWEVIKANETQEDPSWHLIRESEIRAAEVEKIKQRRNKQLKRRWEVAIGLVPKFHQLCPSHSNYFAMLVGDYASGLNE